MMFTNYQKVIKLTSINNKYFYVKKYFKVVVKDKNSRIFLKTQGFSNSFPRIRGVFSEIFPV